MVRVATRSELQHFGRRLPVIQSKSCANATGVVEFVGVKAAALHTAPLPEKKRLIECIGD